MAGFWICLVNVSQGFKYDRAQNMARLWRCEGYTRCWASLNKPEYVILMSQYALICRNNAEYDWICWHIPEKTECWKWQNSGWVWCNIWHKITVQIIEQLSRQRRIQNTVKHFRFNIFSLILLKLHFKWKI